MRIEIQLDDEQARKPDYIRQQTNQDASKLLDRAIEAAIGDRDRQLQASSNDPLAKSKRSQLIGCIKEGDSTASTNYKEIVRKYIVNKHHQEQARSLQIQAFLSHYQLTLISFTNKPSKC